jgi:hypothetical protein
MRLVTKGELLTALGASSDRFTAFMLDPVSFGVPEEYLLGLKIAKQKLDWTGSVDMDLPEIQGLTGLLISFGVIAQSDVDAVRATAPAGYTLTVLAQDTITVDNIFGAVQEGSFWSVRVNFLNATTGESLTETFVFDAPPSSLEEAIDSHIQMLKAR